MRISATFKKEKLTISSKTSCKVKDLLTYLRPNLKIAENDRLVFCSNLKVYNPTDTIVENKGEEFLLLTLSTAVECTDAMEIDDANEGVDQIESLISKVTGADKVLRKPIIPTKAANNQRANNDLIVMNNISIENVMNQVFRGNNVVAVEIDRNSLNSLCDMGFNRQLAINALRIARGDVERATEFLLNSVENNEMSFQEALTDDILRQYSVSNREV
jgi:hypothetical protein